MDETQPVPKQPNVASIPPRRAPSPVTRRAMRERMTTEEAKATYRARVSLRELANAHLKHKGSIAQVLVRGTDNVTCVALLAALTVNLVQHATRPARRAIVAREVTRERRRGAP